MAESEASRGDAGVDRSGQRTLLLQAARASLKASEDRYRAIVTNADEGILTTDTHMLTTFVNERLASMLGYTVEEMLGLPADAFVDASARDGMRQGFERRRQGIREHRELELLRRDGSSVWSSVSLSPLTGPDGQFLGALIMGTDITERRLAEEARTRLAAIVENSHDAIFAKTLDGKILTWNAGARALYGYTAQEAIGQSVALLIPPERRGELSDALERLKAGQFVPPLETVRRRKDGTEVVVALSIFATRDATGHVTGGAAIARDVTERRRLEEQRRLSEERFRTIFRASPAAIAIGMGGVILEANDRYCDFYGYERTELIGRTVQELELWVDPRERVRMLEGVRAQGSLRDFATKFRRKDGTVRDALMAVETVELSRDGTPAQDVEPTLLIMVVDVTERSVADERLRESEARYRVLFDESPMPMWAYDPQSLQIVMANQAAAELYGYTTDELATLTLPDIRPSGVDAESIRDVNRALPAGRQRTGIWEHRRKDGSRIEVDVHLNDVEFGGRRLKLAVLHDVTKHRGLEEQLRQSQKLEAVGQLAGGIAHDFNNLLTAIIGYSDLLAGRFSVGDPVRAEIQEIRRAGERAAALTRQLLAFSRKQMLVPEALDLGGVARGLSRLLERLIGEQITVSLKIAPDLGRVMADPGQMEQVVMNLALNARDAMPRGGELFLEIRNVDLEEAFLSTHLGATPGPYVMLAVTDTGVGMSAEVQRQIFEPFFTTKPVGEGTGLGLATVHGIVNQSGGTIWVYSEPGRGTTFKIYLPRIAKAVDAPRIVPETASTFEGTETILLVEDAEQLRKLAKHVLELSHYTVLDSGSPAHALEVARAHGGTIDLLLTDVVMPGMSGPEVAELLRLERPGVPVLYMSGYTDDSIVHHGVLAAGTHFIQKPFTPNALVRRVRETLNGRAVPVSEVERE